MKEEMNVREWQKKFSEEAFIDPSFQTQCAAGWYDWFCKDSSLAGKTKKMGRIIAQVKDGGKIDLDKMYVWFKNNCPCVGPLYDDFRFADIETGDTLFTICCDDKRAESKYEVWCTANDFSKPYIGFNTTKELVNWLNTSW